jgi:hypothetical protein
VADIYALAGPKKETLDWLPNAVDRGLINYAFIAQRDPLLKPLCGEPRFREIAA